MGNISKYILREVTQKDCNLLYEWVNDRTVRESSFNLDEISYDEHVSWFNKKLKSKDSFMYVLKVNQDDVGLIRLDKLDYNSFLINYSIAKEYRGKGYATELLKLIKEKYPLSLLIGKVKPTNIGSIKAFIKAGYIMEEELGTKIFYSFNRNQL